ncbi:hypothetical protein UA08_05742 [Talaromyces atroroseus]|uniref:DENN domain-containing protein n=1 Tax=Talaromyces atroroseus TaxID=1441469 RepID=A0A225AWI2_TALAT|nr:hypothetical protein UA08_05742 [Talaromyces atroroseus]OKL58805.1 hypothetical protein UA08_05742 [Talaromyces atroroseus]
MPLATNPAVESSAPLADYFWIAGVDGKEIEDTYWKLRNEYMSNRESTPGPAFSDTIEEDAEPEEEHDSGKLSDSTSFADARNTKRNSYNRLSRLSNDARMSIRSVESKIPEPQGTHSNRSSMTIRPAPSSSLEPPSEANNGEFDFDKALLKFASERESFLSDLSLSAGAITPNRPKPRPKVQKIVAEEKPQSINPLKSGIGSVRRHMSFRDMNSMKRQPSVIARQASIRTSRRLSNYNSVIPVPQPLDTSPAMHPLKRRFEPVLLDRYPQKGMPDEQSQRVSFPDYVPMFAFPNDINIVSSDQKPRSTWHGFVMTGGDGSKLHGVCITLWIPLGQKAAEALEECCEEWRKDNMTDEERELAASLGGRLADERAKLSTLLAQLPAVASGSPEREKLEDDISAVEEKIGLMTDLLRPVRHGAASKIEGLTDDTGFWIPRAYGIMGKNASMTTFWKEWLKAVSVPRTNGGVLRVPASSPTVGIWQPLERYVMNLCTEAFSPISSKTQVELSVRELRLFARNEAPNELPGSRNTDLYALFRSLSISNIIVLFEYALAESRIIFLSSHTSMLYLATRALVDLLFPFTWTGVLIPVLPARLIQALEAPCPYIVGIERRYEKVELPSDDFVLVDLDADKIESDVQPTPLPRHQRKKLYSLLQLAAPHHSRFGVRPGPPSYAVEAYPFDSFPAENPSIYHIRAQPTHLARYASLNSTSFGSSYSATPAPAPIYNAFLHARDENASSRGLSRGNERPTTSSTSKTGSPPSPRTSSPTSGFFPPPLPATPVSRNDSGMALQASLREKRSGHFDASSRRSSSFGTERRGVPRRPSAPFLGHASNLSVTTLNTDYGGASTYAPSVYATSTIAASTIVPQAMAQPVFNTDSTCWIEGHCLQLQPRDDKIICSICDERSDEKMYKCTGCKTHVHDRCAPLICIVCPAAFHPEQIRAAFKYLLPASKEHKKSGLTYHFNMDAFLKSLPHEHADYMTSLQQTQGFNEFISERERSKPNTRDSKIVLFDEIILSKRNRGRTSIFSGRMNTDFLSNTSEHLWRSAAATSFPPTSRVHHGISEDYSEVIKRAPAKLDHAYMKEPRMVQGVPRVSKTANNARRKPLPKLMNGLSISPP